MKSIDELRTLVEQELFGLKYPSSPADLYSPIEYILSLGGKRMRPILLLLAHQLFDKDIQKAIKPSLSIEVFHNFTLLHDDIMDKAPVRRGKATVHTKWNENVAILSGDAMLIQSYQYLCDLPPEQLTKCLAVFNEMAIQVCEGQQYDMDFEIQAEVDMESYLKMIEFKTAVLLGAALKMGAIIGGSTEKQADALYEFGRNIGIAFQLKDDLLDVFGDAQTFGKQVGGDIIANKKTCLYLKALSLSEGEHKMELVNLYSSESVNDTEKVERVKFIYDSMDMQSHIHLLIDEYYTKAMKFLNSIDADLSELERFASLLKKREN
jgi:geranylgeranyl diphosphate synthase type II